MRALNLLSTLFTNHASLGKLKALFQFQLQGADLFKVPFTDRPVEKITADIDPNPISTPPIDCPLIDKIRAMDIACSTDFKQLDKINLIEQRMKLIPSKAAHLKELHDELRDSIICAYATELEKQKIDPPKINAKAELALMIEDVYEHMLAKNPTILKPLLRNKVEYYVEVYTHIWGGHTVRMSPYSNQLKPM